MSCKVGNKSHKSRCEKYKSEGRRAINKQKKAKRHEKRMERFATRKAEGKSYKYNKERTEKKREDRIPIGSNLNSNCGRHTEFARWDAISTELKKYSEIQKKELAKKYAAKKTDNEDDE